MAKGTLQMWLRLGRVFWSIPVGRHEPLKAEDFLQLETERGSRRGSRRIRRARGARPAVAGGGRVENMRRWLPPGVSRGWGPQSDSHKELKSASERHEAGSRVLPGSSRKDLSPADGHLPFRHPKLTTHLSHAVSRADKWPQRPRCKEADGKLPSPPLCRLCSVQTARGPGRGPCALAHSRCQSFASQMRLSQDAPALRDVRTQPGSGCRTGRPHPQLHALRPWEWRPGWSPACLGSS